MNHPTTTLPRSLQLGGSTLELTRMQADDAAALAAFAAALPPHDLLFLRRDISHPKVVAACLGRRRPCLPAWAQDRQARRRRVSDAGCVRHPSWPRRPRVPPHHRGRSSGPQGVGVPHQLTVPIPMAHAGATWFMTGLISFVQIVHDPLMGSVIADALQ